MAEQGLKVLDSADIAAGSVTVTPAATPTHGTASICFERQVMSQMNVHEEPRRAVVSGNDLVITLAKRPLMPGQTVDRVGRKLCWTSY